MTIEITDEMVEALYEARFQSQRLSAGRHEAKHPA
jgi:hypothetical protein